MDSDAPLGAQLTKGSLLAGRYRLLSPIATGGMAQVWRAEDTVLGRQVAAKVLHPHLATDQAFLIRFQREAIAAARLSHRSIVAIFDTVSDSGTEAIIMELLEGRTMRAVLDENGPLPVRDLIDIGIQIAEALSEAHRGGVVHRDVKPSNILLCPDRRVMVTDFGIAKAGEDTDLTVTGTLLGTAKYLSPEQVLGDDVDPRSDLYSLGIVLYEAAAGRAPFRAETDAATALARLHQTPRPLSGYRSDLPPQLISIIDRLMARDPDHRWTRAVDVRTALASLISASPDPSVDDTAVDSVDRTVLLHSPDDTGLVGAIPAPTLQESGEPSQRNARDPEVLAEERTPDETDDHPGFLSSERSWMMPALIVLTLAGALALAGLLLTQPGIGIDDSSATPTIPAGDGVALTPTNELVEPTIVSLTTLDPPSLGGDGSENDNLLPQAYDGDEDSSWRTDKYTRAGFAGLKPGVGLVVDLGGTARVDELSLQTNTDGWAMSIFVGDDFDSGPDTWGDPVTAGQDLDGLERFDLEGSRGTKVLLWLTEPGVSPDRDGDGTDDFRFELAELEIG